MTPPLRPASVLDRASYSASISPTPLQSQVDGLVGGFAETATDWRTIASMTAGGAAYRVARLGVAGAGTGTAVRVLSVGAGLSAEVSTFEMTHRSLLQATGRGTPNLFRWEGAGGLRQGLLSSFVAFGALKGAGRLAQGENLIAQHLFQDSAMVLGNQITGALNLAPRPTGSLAEQFLHAEATNLQLGAGMALAGRLAPGVQALERGLDLSTEFPSGRVSTPDGEMGRNLALATAGRAPRAPRESEVELLLNRPLAMAAAEEDGAAASSSPEVRARGLASSEPALEKPSDWPANIPLEWAGVQGSGLKTSREVTNTDELNRAIVEDGIKTLLGEDAIHSIFGYGSFELFRNGRPENIRMWDADKKPDYIIVGDNARMIENLARRWNLTQEQTNALKDHAAFTPKGFREGFVFFNTDILVPGRGPVAFKISLVDTNAFFARRSRGPILEYSQIRLKDATAQNLVWSRDRERSLAHLEAIRDQMFDEAFLRMGGGLTSLYRPLNLFRFKFTGRELGEWFYRLSYRVEAYRFWENGFGSWDKGAKLFKERSEENRELLVEEFRRFALRNRRTFRINGERVEPTRIQEQITPQNLYDAIFTDVGLTRGAIVRSLRFWGSIPHYTKLNLRGLSSYIRHGLPANKSSQAYYRQPPEEYAGRKARRLVYPPGATEVHPVARFLAKPGIKRTPILNKIALDSVYYPVYYSDLAPHFNNLYRKGQISDREYDALMGWLATSPRLTQLRDAPLLSSLRELMHGSDPAARDGAIRTFRAIERLPLLDPKIQAFIRALNLSPTESVPFLTKPSEIEEIMEAYLPVLNLLCAGKNPRIYDWLRLSLRRSFPQGSPRLRSLIDYIDQSEEGSETQLRKDVMDRNERLDPKLALSAIPEPPTFTMEAEVRNTSHVRSTALAEAETLPAPPANSNDGE